jgi:ubiquinone/menaquinone biosynthesis C-methylase UbiE
VELGVGGEGGLIDLLKETNETLGLDASRSAVELCRQRGLNVTLMNLDVDRLPFSDQFIEIVLAMEVFEHFASSQSVLEQVQRVLGPGGVFLISTPNPLICHWPRFFIRSFFAGMLSGICYGCPERPLWMRWSSWVGTKRAARIWGKYCT